MQMTDKYSHGKCKECRSATYLKNEVCGKCEKIKAFLGEESSRVYKGDSVVGDLQKIFGIKK